MPSLSIAAREAALKNSRAHSASSFGMPMRTGDLNNFQDGDVITIPACQIVDGKLVDMQGNELVIQEPMMQNNAQVTRTNADGTTEAVELTYMIVDVKRAGRDTTARLFASLFWKSRVAYEESGSMFKKGKRQVANGDVIDEARKHHTVDEAIVAIAKRGSFTFTRNAIKTVPFGGNTTDPELEAKDIVDDFIPTLNFVKSK